MQTLWRKLSLQQTYASEGQLKYTVNTYNVSTFLSGRFAESTVQKPFLFAITDNLFTTDSDYMERIWEWSALHAFVGIWGMMREGSWRLLWVGWISLSSKVQVVIFVYKARCNWSGFLIWVSVSLGDKRGPWCFSFYFEN